MGWNAPPEHVRRRVNAIIGRDIYPELEAAYRRVQAIDAGLREGYWYRAPGSGSIRRRSQHPLGLAVDVYPSPSKRDAVIEALRRETFHVIPYPRHLHVQALPPTVFQQLLPALERAGLWNR